MQVGEERPATIFMTNARITLGTTGLPLAIVTAGEHQLLSAGAALQISTGGHSPATQHSTHLLRQNSANKSLCRCTTHEHNLDFSAKQFHCKSPMFSVACINVWILAKGTYVLAAGV